MKKCKKTLEIFLGGGYNIDNNKHSSAKGELWEAMYATGTKKMLIILILRVLYEHSDEEHRLTQKEVARILKRDYDMDCDRRSVKANVDALVELGYDIGTDGGYYLAGRPFDDAELSFLIDSVEFSRTLPKKRADALVEKLLGLGSKYFREKPLGETYGVSELRHGYNGQTAYVMDALNSAVKHGRQVSFIYNDYGTDFKLHPRRDEPYVVNPYALVMANGRHYLVGNYDKYDNCANYRVDRITDVEILERRRKPAKLVTGLERGLDVSTHVSERPYMFSGFAELVTFVTKKTVFNDLVDWFGKFRVISETETEIKARVSVNPEAMRFFALQYGIYLEILSPESLRERVAGDVAEMARKYGVGAAKKFE